MTDVSSSASQGRISQPRVVKAKRYKVASLLMLVFFLVLSATAYYFFVYKKSVLSPSVVEQAGFTVYAPKSAPSGFQLDETKTGISRNFLTYGFVSDDASREITVTVQPIPPGFDMSAIINHGKISSTDIELGTLYDLSAGGTSKYLINSGDTLIFLLSPKSIDKTTVNSLVDSFVAHPRD